MTEMGITIFASHLDALHEETPVFFLHNTLGLKGLRKAWPSGAGVKFVMGAEERFPGDNIDIKTLSLVVPIFILKRPFSAILWRLSRKVAGRTMGL